MRAGAVPLAVDALRQHGAARVHLTEQALALLAALTARGVSLEGEASDTGRVSVVARAVLTRCSLCLCGLFPW